MPTEDLKKYLESISEKSEVSDDLIFKFVLENTRKNVVSKTRIIAGEVNEVYEIILEDNSIVILRISQRGRPEFQQEQWAIGLCQKVGVPIPKILQIQYHKINGSERGFCLMEKSRGELLERGSIKIDTIGQDKLKQYANQAGEILSKIHNVGVTGWGQIVGEGRTPYSDALQMWDEWLKDWKSYEKLATEVGLDGTTMDFAYKICNKYKKQLSSSEPCLNHGDYFPKHFMIDGEEIIGILDWGEIRGDSPVYDFANWDYWVGDRFPLPWLQEGYISKGVFNDGFDDLLHFMKIRICLENMEWYHKQKYLRRVEKSKEKLIICLEHFK